jgi:5-methylcytosine-specific restriction endonuclease McrA
MTVSARLAIVDRMTSPGRRTVSRADYRAYIQSREWAAVRARFWASDLPQECYVCGAPRRPRMHLHHRTYKNLGAERLMDLVPLCPSCHELVHDMHRSDPSAARRGLWETTKRARVAKRKGRA